MFIVDLPCPSIALLERCATGQCRPFVTLPGGSRRSHDISALPAQRPLADISVVLS
jgi:hypothetical protein